MKQLNYYFIIVLAAALLGCRSPETRDPANVPVWDQIQLGMAKQQVYAIAGKPLREGDREAEWQCAEPKGGHAAATPASRSFKVFFDEDGRVTGMWISKPQ